MYRVYRCVRDGRMYSRGIEKECPRCNGPVTFLRENKTVPSNAFDVTGVALHREPRAPRPKKFSSDMIGGAMYEFTMSTHAAPPPPGASAAAATPEDDDPDWLPPPRYNLTMRYTATGRTHRDESTVICPGEHLQDSGWVPVRGAAGRISANRTMGGSARARSGRGAPYRPGSRTGEEWCHLIADSLGGATVAGNLVAASFGANTMMGAIERLIHGDSDYEVRVVAYCSAPHVAEILSYGIRLRGRTQVLLFSIDATSTGFSHADGDFVATAFKNWVNGGHGPALHR